MLKRQSILCAVLALAACTSVSNQPGFDAADSKAWDTNTLYARDGKPVAGAKGPEDGAAPRELRSNEVHPSESGRMYILELYQKAIDERDGLKRELATLGGDFDNAKAQLADTQKQFAEAQKRLAELESDNKRQVEENIDLAGRLVTAQIRRLQVEKILLEQKIAQKNEAAKPAETKQP
jgi:hypothetical protein